MSWDWERTRVEFERAMALNPRLSTTLIWHATYLGLVEGAFDQAIAEATRAVEIDPLSGSAHASLGTILMRGDLGRSPSSLQAAIQCFEQVIALDPDYALAYAGLADCYAIYRVYGWHSDAKCRPPVLAAVERAVALDPSLAEVHYSQALVPYYFDRHWRAAETHLRRALAINVLYDGARSRRLTLPVGDA